METREVLTLALEVTHATPARDAALALETLMIRIANGQGFWGDWLEAPVRLVDQGPIDYLVLDYLAEVTMSILQKQSRPTRRSATPATSLPSSAVSRKPMLDRNIKVIANAGGVNPIACAQAVRKVAPELKVAVVLGDDVFNSHRRIPRQRLRDAPIWIPAQPITTIRDRILSANAYIGAFPLAEALDTGARRRDRRPIHRHRAHSRPHGPPVPLEPRRLGQTRRRHHRRAHHRMRRADAPAATARSIGKTFPTWPTSATRSSKPNRTERSSSPNTQERAAASIPTPSRSNLLYELGDPQHYITPDCIADFTTIQLADIGPDRVRVTGIRGRERPANLKLSISYANGWKAIGTLVYSWPQAVEKARAADRIVRGAWLTRPYLSTKSTPNSSA